MWRARTPHRPLPNVVAGATPGRSGPLAEALAEEPEKEISPVRVVGYVRESADPSDDRAAFSQQEDLRRHAAEHGHRLVAICQDLRSPGQSPKRDGYLSLLGVVASGSVDAVLVPGVATFSTDAIVQEIILWDLLGRGIRVISTDEADVKLLDRVSVPAPSRLVIRDVLERVAEHKAGFGSHRVDPPGIPPDGDVLVQIIEADAVELAGGGDETP